MFPAIVTTQLNNQPNLSWFDSKVGVKMPPPPTVNFPQLQNSTVQGKRRNVINIVYFLATDKDMEQDGGNRIFNSILNRTNSDTTMAANI